MAIFASRAVSTKAAVVPWTVFHFVEWINMHEITVFITARSEFCIKIALRHALHIILVKKLAIVTLFAQTSEPVLAHCSFFNFNMSERTIVTKNAHFCSFEVFTFWSISFINAFEG